MSFSFASGSASRKVCIGKIDGSIRVRAVAPKLGQHNAEIFDRMRLSEQDIETLQAQRVV